MSGCSDDDDEKQPVPAAVDCPDGAKQAGALPPEGNMLWCERTDENGNVYKDGPWVTAWNDKLKTRASEGEYRDDMFYGPYSSWFEGGHTLVAELGNREGDGTVTVYNDLAKAVAEIPYLDGNPVTCPGQAVGGRPPANRAGWCEDGGKKAGRMVTYYADGDIESMFWYHEGTLHGRFQAFHEDGAPWVSGEYVNGKRHGHWVVSEKSGS